jgi:hypothetical protein
MSLVVYSLAFVENVSSIIGSGLAWCAGVVFRLAIGHDILDFCVRELVTFGKSVTQLLFPHNPSYNSSTSPFRMKVIARGVQKLIQA